MNKHARNFIILLVVGAIGIAAARVFLPQLQEKLQRSTSDSADIKDVINIGYDSWIGYFPLCSPEMRRQLKQQGYRLNCIDDQADYRSRFKNLKNRELQFAVATVDAYILNAKKTDYPGVIVSVIDESKGGDAIIARKSVIPDINSIKKPTKPKIAFTPDSPSEHLLKAINTYFDLGLYSGKQNWKVETDGSEKAYKSLDKGSVDIAVLWEPDVSRALATGEYIKLISTDETDKLIVDILLVERLLSSEKPEMITTLLQTYFKTLKYYMQYPEELESDIRSETGLKTDSINQMLRGVAWAGLLDNGLDWFGTANATPGTNDGLIESIEVSLDILKSNGDFRTNPLPGKDPYRIINSHFIDKLYQSGASVTTKSTGKNSLSGDFTPLTKDEWKHLKKVGTLKVEPVSFRRGTNTMDYAGSQAVDLIVSKIKRYPKFRIFIEGHTGIRGDQEANLMLSTERAAAIANYLVSNYNIDPDRVRAVGYGASRPLEKIPGESSRAYGYRLPRVEVSLARDSF